MENRLLVLKEHNGQKGVFSRTGFSKGEKIVDFHGEFLDRDDLPDEIITPEQDRFVQISERGFLGPSGNFDDYINHSCDPNCGLKIEGSGASLYAIKDIKKGDEITWDYSTSMFNEEWSMKCECGSKNCRKIIKEFKSLPENIKNKYKKLGIVPDYNLE